MRKGREDEKTFGVIAVRCAHSAAGGLRGRGAADHADARGGQPRRGRNAVHPHGQHAIRTVRAGDRREPEQSDNQIYESWDEVLEQIYKREGSFFLRRDDMEEFHEWAQDEPRDFVIHPEPGADGDKRTEAISEDGMITDMNEYTRLRNEYDMKTAETFAALGCPVRVCAESSIEDGEEMKDYVCIITVTPARLWELSGQVDGLYYVERLWDSVKERFDETVWTSEGA